MLKNIPATLSPDLLWCLASMGHGERLVLVDRNFPAHDVARHTATGRLIELPGLDIPQATRAILSVMPLDSFVDTPAERMEMVGKPTEIPPVQAEVQKVIDAREGKSWPMGSIERFAFYEKARDAYAVIVTGETRFYGCFVLKKGVIPPKA